MPAPSTIYDWATNTLASGGPAVGTPTKVVPSGGLQAEGWEPGDRPSAQNLNELLSNIYLWLNWLKGLSVERVRPLNIQYPQVSGDTGASLSTLAKGFTGANQAEHIPVDVNSGETLTSLDVKVSCGATDVLVLELFKVDLTGTSQASTLLATATTSDHSGNIVTKTLTPSSPELVDTTAFYYVLKVRCSAYATGPKLYQGFLHYTLTF